MYAIIDYNKLREIFTTQGEIARGTIVDIECSHDAPIPTIVAPMLVWENSIALGEILDTLSRHNADNSTMYSLAKCMAIPKGIRYQVLTVGTSGVFRDNGNLPQPDLTLMYRDMAQPYPLNAVSRTMLHERAVNTSELFDAVGGVILMQYMLHEDHRVFETSRQNHVTRAINRAMNRDGAVPTTDSAPRSSGAPQ